MEELIRRFLGEHAGMNFGYCYGYGDADTNGYDGGSGEGCGYGEGSSAGYGDGGGDGFGDGFGQSNGTIDASGRGVGEGNGKGHADGLSNGHGDGIYPYSVNGKRVYIIDTVPTIIESVHGNYARGYIVKTIADLEPTFIARYRGYLAHGETVHKATHDVVAKYGSALPIEKRVEFFIQYHPHIDELHKGWHYFTEHQMLTGSCEQGRNAFCKAHGLDMDKSYTVREFISICRDAYGGEVIRKLEEAYIRRAL